MSMKMGLSKLLTHSIKDIKQTTKGETNGKDSIQILVWEKE